MGPWSWNLSIYDGDIVSMRGSIPKNVNHIVDYFSIEGFKFALDMI